MLTEGVMESVVTGFLAVSHATTFLSSVSKILEQVKMAMLVTVQEDGTASATSLTTD